MVCSLVDFTLSKFDTFSCFPEHFFFDKCQTRKKNVTNVVVSPLKYLFLCFFMIMFFQEQNNGTEASSEFRKPPETLTTEASPGKITNTVKEICYLLRYFH